MSSAICTQPACEEIGTAQYSEGFTDYKISHNYALNLEIAGIKIFEVVRAFNLLVRRETKGTPTRLVSKDGVVTVCAESAHLDTLTGELSETLDGVSSKILYADIENKVFLIKETTEKSTIDGSEKQNPFRFKEPYASGTSVAFFPKRSRITSERYFLSVRGVIVYTKTIGAVASAPVQLTPIVWPNPSKDAAFFTGAEEYDWINQTGFYNYNDPKDVGFAPCVDVVSGDGAGLLTGYSLAVADGGKDFFYPEWVRNSFLPGSNIHRLWAFEADKRFYNRLGGQVSEICAEPYKLNYDLPLEIVSEPVGNFVTSNGIDFYSFYLPEIKQAITSLGNADITKAFEDYYKNVFKTVNKRDYDQAADPPITHYPLSFAI